MEGVSNKMGPVFQTHKAGAKCDVLPSIFAGVMPHVSFMPDIACRAFGESRRKLCASARIRSHGSVPNGLYSVSVHLPRLSDGEY